MLDDISAAKTSYQLGLHKNIVSVFKYKRDTPHFEAVVDMELCDLTVDNYIQGDWTPELETRVPCFATVSTSEVTLSHVWDIMEDVTKALVFIHGQGKIHYNIEPSNSAPLI